MSCACCVEQRLAFTLQKVGKGCLTLKKEQLSAIHSAYDQEDAFSWLLTGFGKSIEYKCSPFYSITGPSEGSLKWCAQQLEFSGECGKWVESICDVALYE